MMHNNAETTLHIPKISPVRSVAHLGQLVPPTTSAEGRGDDGLLARAGIAGTWGNEMNGNYMDRGYDF